MAASKAPSANGSASALAATQGAAPAGRWARITAEGSTATTSRSRRLVGAGAGADVEHALGVAQRRAQMRAAMRGRSRADGVVQRPRGRRAACRQGTPRQPGPSTVTIGGDDGNGCTAAPRPRGGPADGGELVRPRTTTLDDFRAQTFAVGDEVQRDVVGPRSELAGAWDVLHGRGLRAGAGRGRAVRPSPAAGRRGGARGRAPDARGGGGHGVDGAYVLLHGSAVAHGDDDPEGTLLTALRAELGPGRPIVASLDHHAHLTRRMLDAVDALTAYRTCPHVDLYERGAQAAEILAGALAGPAAAGVPHGRPADDHPRRPARLQPRPVPGGDGAGRRGGGRRRPGRRRAAGAALARRAGARLEGRRHHRRRPRARDPAGRARHRGRLRAARGLPRRRAAEPRRRAGQALAGPAPYVLADAGDATNAGAPGDSTVLLRTALAARRRRRVLLAVRDAAAAAQAHAAGVGAEVELVVGEGEAGDYAEATALRGRVAACSTASCATPTPRPSGSATGRARRARRRRRPPRRGARAHGAA